MTSASAVDANQLIWDVNNEKARLFTPAMLYVGILMFLGIIGNGLVLYFYGHKSKTTPSTSFIIALAVYDSATCAIGMPMEITDLRYFYNFESDAACRIIRFVTHFASISSGLTLVIIAVDRYRRICKPFERQMNNGHVKVLCLITGVMSVILSWPAIVFNKVVEVDIIYTYNVTLTGHDCTTTKEESLKPYMLAFNIVYLIAFLLITITLAVLYTFIGRQLFKHQKFRFYIAKKTSRVRRVHVNTSADITTTESLLGPRQLTSAVFADPPDASESVTDLREFVTRGLTPVEEFDDRPASGSGYSAITNTTGVTGLTGLTELSGKTKRSIHSIKSVTICDPSQNKVYSIEARDNNRRPGSGKSDVTWPHSRQRPDSASSFATFSSRTSSATYLSFSDVPKPRSYPHIVFSDNLGFNNDKVDDETEVKSKQTEQNELDESTVEVHETQRSTLVVVSPVKDEHAKTDTTNIEHAEIETENAEKDITTIDADKHGVDIEVADETVSASAVKRTKSTKSVVFSENEQDYNKRPSHARPTSRESRYTRSSRVSSNATRSSVLTQSSRVTSTSSVASRASTVKSSKRFGGGHFGSGKMNTDTDNVKDLRMKMLDINTIKYTTIMLVITIVFVLSFLPYLSLVIWRYYKDEHESHILNDTELVMFQIGIRSFFLNSSLNPLIYGGFNSKFRAFFYSLFCRCCIKKRHNTRSRIPRDKSDSTSGT